MKALKRKLRSVAGDSMVEVLAAILIAAMGAALLATMVVSATSVIGKNESAMNGIYTAEAAVAATKTGEGTASIKGMGSNSGFSASAEVDVYKSGDFTRYEPESDSTPGEGS